MHKADDIIARWEARTAGKLVAEIEERRRSRIIAFTRVDLMRSVLATAAFRTARALGIPPSACRAALVPDEERKQLKPGIEIDNSVEVDPVAVKHVFSFAFKQVSAEWRFDLGFVNADARFSPTLAEKLPRKETLAEFAARLALALEK